MRRSGAWGGVLDRHIALQTWRYWLLTLGALSAGTWLAVFTEQRRRGFNAGQAVKTALQYLPDVWINTILLSIAVAAAAAAAYLHRSGALTAAEATGRAPYRTALAFAWAGITIGAVALFALTPLQAACNRATANAAQAAGDKMPGLLRINDTVFRRFGAPSGNYFLKAARYADNQFSSASVIVFGADDLWQKRYQADVVRIDNDRLVLSGKVRLITPDNSGVQNPADNTLLPILPTAQDASAMRPSMLSFTALHKVINVAEQRQEKARDYRLRYHALAALPLTAGVVAGAAAAAMSRRQRRSAYAALAGRYATGGVLLYLPLPAGEIAAASGLLAPDAAIWGTRIIVALLGVAIVSFYNEK